MNSRDRLSNGTLRKQIEEQLEDVISRHHGLRDLRERRRSEEIAERLEDSKPLEDILGSILKSSPSLNRLFLLGQRLSRPHRGRNGNGAGGSQLGSYEGKPHPSFFRFAKKPSNTVLNRTTEIGRRCRIKFETDVVNDYFTRSSVPGHYYVEILDGAPDGLDLDHSLTLHDGIANWSISLPTEINVGDELTLQCTVTDDTLVEPYVNVARIQVQPQQKTSSGSGGRSGRTNVPGGTRKGAGSKGSSDQDTDAGIKLPTIHRVRDGDELWNKYSFDEHTACMVIEDAVQTDGAEKTEYTFYVNASNLYLLTDMKSAKDDPALTETKFVFGNVLVGLAVLHDSNGNRGNNCRGRNEEDPPEKQVEITTRALAPFLLPMIDYLGSLTPDEVSGLGSIGDEE